MRKHIFIVAMLLLVLALGGSTLLADTTFTPSISRWVVAGGGGTAQGGSFTINGTAGQAVAGSASGGSYQLNSGFWGEISDATPDGKHLFLPLVMR